MIDEKFQINVCGWSFFKAMSLFLLVLFHNEPTNNCDVSDNIQQQPVYSVLVPTVRLGLSATGGSTQGHGQGGPQTHASR